MKRDPERISEILQLLATHWAKYPNIGLGQLIYEAAIHGGWRKRNIFDCEDDIMLKGLKKMLERHE